MAESNLSYSLSLKPGQTIVIEVPVDSQTGTGHFPKGGAVVIGGTIVNLVNGFAQKLQDVGTLTAYSPPQGGLAVKYKQVEAGSNSIYFYAVTGEKQVVNIISMPVHDHSSIYHGGPAFGTYASSYDDSDPQPNT